MLKCISKSDFRDFIPEIILDSLIFNMAEKSLSDPDFRIYRNRNILVDLYLIRTEEA